MPLLWSCDSLASVFYKYVAATRLRAFALEFWGKALLTHATERAETQLHLVIHVANTSHACVIPMTMRSGCEITNNAAPKTVARCGRPRVTKSKINNGTRKRSARP